MNPFGFNDLTVTVCRIETKHALCTSVFFCQFQECRLVFLAYFQLQGKRTYETKERQTERCGDTLKLYFSFNHWFQTPLPLHSQRPCIYRLNITEAIFQD